MNPTKSVENWSVEDVRDWLLNIGCGEYRALFTKHKINGPALKSLTEKELFRYMEITVVGDVKQIVLAIKKLQIKVYNSANYDVLLRSTTDNYTPKTNPNGHLSRKDIPLKGATKYQNHVRTSSLDSNISDVLGNEDTFIQGIPSDPALRLEPEIWKTFLSIAYFIAVTLITSVTMVVVHDRVPDMKKYPPLPDIFLDNVPLIPWAFDMCELTGCVLMLLWGAVLVFHKHRFILMRRFFALSGSVFLIRCITMLITSLSVPGSHLECSPRPYGNVWARLRQAYLIWSGFGMSVVGVRTCGDYMFSGHTVVLTMLNFFITEYTSRRIYFLHTLTWLLNMFGIFFILAAHEHYSIDVFVAFYITSRLFLYYHTLANNRTLMQRDSRRTKVWFPLFSFFESRVEGIIPNEFEWPVTWSKLKNFVNYVGSHFSKLEKSHNKEQVKKESKRKKCS